MRTEWLLKEKNITNKFINTQAILSGVIFVGNIKDSLINRTVRQNIKIPTVIENLTKEYITKIILIIKK